MEVEGVHAKNQKQQNRAERKNEAILAGKINASTRFESQIAISQSARADKTHRSFDRHIHPTGQFSLTEEAMLTVHEWGRGGSSNHYHGRRHFSCRC